MTSAGKLFTLVSALVLISLFTLGFGAPVFAEDLSDNETCLECHEDADRAPPKNAERPQVHNPAGGFFVEDHDMWSCNDCHTYITEVPHAEEVLGSEVDCTNCHEEDPTK